MTGGGKHHHLSSRELEDSIRLGHENDVKVGGVRLYSKPNQRQRWGDNQMHPVVNYGDLFFDLFYVAAAYNLSYIIRDSPSTEGFLYFVACFWSVYLLWWDKTHYDSRFFTYDDAYHRVFTVAVLIATATVVLHIRPVKILSDPNNNIEPFLLCIGLLVASVLSAMRYIEMLVFGCLGQPVTMLVARNEFFVKALPIFFYWAATILTGLAYYQDFGREDFGYRMMAETTATNSTTTATMTAVYVNDKSSKVPIYIYIILGGAASCFVCQSIRIFTLPPSPQHKQFSVPMNIDFVIHRYGEWTLLMLGEAILSLLIVGVVSTADFYGIFFCGILTVTLLQYMHFRSQPHHANEHAMRRSRNAGYAFAVLMQVYSAALIILGVSYKMLLYEVKTEQGKRRMLFPTNIPRWLAAGTDAGETTPVYDTNDRRQRIAHFFCISMAMIFFCSDAMLLAHRGIKVNMQRCQCPEKKLKVKNLLLVLLRMALLVFTGTFSQYETNPVILAEVGLAIVISQIALRVLSSLVFKEEYPVHSELKEKQEQEPSVPTKEGMQEKLE